MGDQHHAQDLRCDLLRFLRRFRKLYSTAFAASTGVDLRFYDDDVRAQLAGRCLGLIRGASNDSARYRNAVIFEQSLAMIFVNFHKSPEKLRFCRMKSLAFEK